jgi:hypothetical protein
VSQSVIKRTTRVGRTTKGSPVTWQPTVRLGTAATAILECLLVAASDEGDQITLSASRRRSSRRLQMHHHEGFRIFHG